MTYANSDLFEYWDAVGKGDEFCKWIGDNTDGVFFGNGSTRSLLDKYNLWQFISRKSAYIFKSNPEIYLDEVDYRYDNESESYRAFTLLNTFKLVKNNNGNSSFVRLRSEMIFSDKQFQYEVSALFDSKYGRGYSRRYNYSSFSFEKSRSRQESAEELHIEMQGAYPNERYIAEQELINLEEDLAHLIKNFLQKDLLKGVSEIVKHGRNHHHHMNKNLYKNKKAFITTNYDCIFEYLFPLRSNCQAATDGFSGVNKAHEIREIGCKKEDISIIRPHGTIIISRRGRGVREDRTYTKHSISRENIEQFVLDINQGKIQPNIVFSTQNNKEMMFLWMDCLNFTTNY